jgi:adenylate cyclase
MLLTLLVIVVLCVASIVFGKDATSLAKTITDPLQELCVAMGAVATMHLDGACVKYDSTIYEIDMIQKSFLIMKHAMNSFGRYVPMKVVRVLVTRGEEAKLGVYPREVTIFFSDIANFTTIAEQLEPQELLLLLSEYFQVMANMIHASGGTLGEFIGDAILAWWNAPDDVDDHAYQCVATAMCMHEELKRLRVKCAERGWPDIFIRIGIHTAEVMVGNIGSNERMKYGLLGDGVNLASRLEELNKAYGTSTMVSEDVINASPRIQDDYHIRPVDAVVVKGRSGVTKVYEVGTGSRSVCVCAVRVSAGAVLHLP